jgi:hypothetical protein
MTIEINELAKNVLSASRRGFFRRKPIFSTHKIILPDELEALNRKIGIPIPGELQEWLLAVGYGDLDDELSFREEWFAVIEKGQLKGGAIFAQDILGNYYAFDSHGCIYYFSRSQHVFAKVSEDFLIFIKELISRDYKLVNWVETLNIH